jgi:hypothetical protein
MYTDPWTQAADGVRTRGEKNMQSRETLMRMSEVQGKWRRGTCVCVWERERERERESERERLSTSKCGRVSGVAGKAVGVGWDVVGQRKGRAGRSFIFSSAAAGAEKTHLVANPNWADNGVDASFLVPAIPGVSGEAAATSFCQTVSPLSPSVSKSVGVTRSTASRLHPPIWPTVVRSLRLYPPTFTYVYPQPTNCSYSHTNTYIHTYLPTYIQALSCSAVLMKTLKLAFNEPLSLLASSLVFGSQYKLFLEQKHWSTN